MTPKVTIKRSDLGPITRLSAGGQGVVYRTDRKLQQLPFKLVFKEYKPEVMRQLDATVLGELPAYVETLPFSEAMKLLSLCAWPCRLVQQAGQVQGFLMPTIPDEFFIDLKLATGLTRREAQFQHLLNPPDFLARRQIAVSDQDRYRLLRATADGLALLHSHRIAVGDVSPKNLLFSLSPEVRVFFLDCDAVRIKGRSVAAQVETPGWEVRTINPNEELATVATDSYKFGLLALRLLAGHQDTRDPKQLPSTTYGPVGRLVARALSTHPQARPRLAEWGTALAEAARQASASRRPSAGSAAASGRAGRPAATGPAATTRSNPIRSNAPTTQPKPAARTNSTARTSPTNRSGSTGPPPAPTPSAAPRQPAISLSAPAPSAHPPPPAYPPPPASTSPWGPAIMQSLSGTTPPAYPPPAPAPRSHFLTEQKPFHRVGAGLIAMLAVWTGAYVGATLSAMNRFSPSQSTAADFVVSRQSDMFGFSLLTLVLVALLGSRQRWLPALACLYGAVGAWALDLTPRVAFVPLRAPAPVRTVWLNLAHSFGQWLVWVALLAVPVCLGLLKLIDRLSPPLSPAQRQARANRRAAVRRFLGRRSPLDRKVIPLWLTLCLTGLPAWAIGRFVLNDNFILKRSPAVFDLAARQFWSYAWPYWLGGAVVLSLIAGAVLVCQRWSGRIAPALIGLALLASSALIGPPSIRLVWDDAEAETVERLTTTAYPFDEHYLTCGSTQAMLTEASGRTALWQAHSARVKGSETEGCNRLAIYRGWQRIAQIDFEPDRVLWPGDTAPDGTSPLALVGDATADAQIRFVSGSASDPSPEQAQLGLIDLAQYDPV
ncbi:MAG: hypothetical protein LBJ44_02785 [Propionibacteriaceae bacterium]|jgi:serine/threonine protein kinase|nr:hypothetical protein [Propionibacteriaceae bacterium]